MPQFLFWKVTTGHWFFYSYGQESFHLRDPHILNGLFGFRKGWFVYTPLALIAFFGLPLLLRRKDTQSYPVMALLFYIPFIYITFCWWAWWYGGGFGSRVMIETLPLLALPLTLLIQGADRKRTAVRVLSTAVIVLCIALNLFQQWQYLHGIIHYEDMNYERYWQVFGRTTTDGLPAFP